MTSEPRVTVGLPVFNGEPYLEAAIDSILGQDFEDFELLLADNGSTDGTSEICQKAAARDSRVTVHRSDVNHGAAWNYNRVVDLARGQYFKWAAHDDVIEPQFLRKCVEVLDADPSVSLCYTRAAETDDDGVVLFVHDLPHYAEGVSPAERVASVILHPSPCMESFGLTRREQLLTTSRIGAYTGSDRTLFLELAMLGRFHEVPEVLFRHRQHSGRSVHQYADARARNVWFSPTWEGKRSAPRCRLLREYARAALASPARRRDRLQTLVPIGRWALKNRNVLARETASFVLGLTRSTTTQPSTVRSAS